MFVPGIFMYQLEIIRFAISSHKDEGESLSSSPTTTTSDPMTMIVIDFSLRNDRDKHDNQIHRSAGSVLSFLQSLSQHQALQSFPELPLLQSICVMDFIAKADHHQHLVTCMNELFSWLGEEIWRIPLIVDFFDRRDLAGMKVLPLLVQESYIKMQALSDRVEACDTHLSSIEQSLESIRIALSGYIDSSKDEMDAIQLARQQKIAARKAKEMEAKERYRQELERVKNLTSDVSLLYPPITTPVNSLVNTCRTYYQALHQFQSELTHLTDILTLPNIPDPSHQTLSLSQKTHTREKLVQYICGQVKQLFKTSLYLVDPEIIGCSLHFPRPSSSTIRLCLVVGQTSLESWDVILFEHLTALSEVSKATVSDFLDDLSEEGDESIVSRESPQQSSTKNRNREEPPIISNIQRVSSWQTAGPTAPVTISCLVDDTSVLIDTNSLLFLSFYSLLEDFSLFCGKDHLLKRSFVFIWDYLHADSRDRTMRFLQGMGVNDVSRGVLQKVEGPECIDQDILWIMVLSIFNKYLPSLSNPLHVLLMLLMDFSFFEPGQHAITIYGLLPIPPSLPYQRNVEGCTLQIPMNQQHPWYLPPALIEKYWNHVNVINPSGGIHEGNPSSTGSSRRGIPTISLRKRFTPGFITTSNPPNQNLPYIAVHPLTHELLFPPSSLLHQHQPLIYRNFSLQDFVLQHLEHLVSSFFSSFLPQPATLMSLSSHDKFDLLMTKFLPPCMQEDILTRQPQLHSFQSNQSSFTITPAARDHLAQSISYCNFIAKSIITESALSFACVDILEMAGALPVGEIGKILIFQTNSHHTSTYIKDKYKGLKRFLEKFPTIFVFGNDHTYNPHVYLMPRLSMEHRRMVTANVLPMEIILIYRRGKPSRKISKQLGQLKREKLKLDMMKESSFDDHY